MKVFRKILKVMGITIGIFAGLICILAIYNQIALKAETDDIIPNGEKRLRCRSNTAARNTAEF